MTLRHPWQAGDRHRLDLRRRALQLAIPRLLGHAVDQAQGVVTAATARRRRRCWTTALMLFAVSVLRGLFTMVQNYYGESVGHHVGYELRLAFYEKLQRLSFGFHDRVHSGDLITLGMLDLEGVRMFFATGLVRLVLLTVLIGVGGYLLISTDPCSGSWPQLRALRRLALVGDAPELRATWLELQERLSVLSPRDGGEPRRHPRRARLRRAGATRWPSSTRLAQRARARARARRHPRRATPAP